MTCSCLCNCSLKASDSSRKQSQQLPCPFKAIAEPLHLQASVCISAAAIRLWSSPVDMYHKLGQFCYPNELLRCAFAAAASMKTTHQGSKSQQVTATTTQSSHCKFSALPDCSLHSSCSQPHRELTSDKAAIRMEASCAVQNELLRLQLQPGCNFQMKESKCQHPP